MASTFPSFSLEFAISLKCKDRQSSGVASSCCRCVVSKKVKDVMKLVLMIKFTVFSTAAGNVMSVPSFERDRGKWQQFSPFSLV